MPVRVKVADILKPIDEVKTQAYFGRHLHTLGLIKWILSQIGPADVWVSSYSTSEEFLRGFRLMRDSGSISSAKMLLDVKASKKTVHLWRLMSACFDDVYLGENHSKVTLFRNDQHVVSVVTSQTRHTAAVTRVPSSPRNHRSLPTCSMDIPVIVTIKA